MRLGLLIAISAAYVAWVLTLPPAAVTSVISATAERVSYRVTNPTSASIEGSFRVTPAGFEDGSEPFCATGEVQPALASDVTYFRVAFDPAIVRIEGGDSAGDLLPADGGRASALPPAVILTADPACGPGLPRRLPVWGPVEIGDTFREPGIADPDRRAHLLLAGTVEVYAESITAFGLPATLYPVRSLVIPAGSRVSSGLFVETGGAGASFGFVVAVPPGGDNDVSREAFQVSLSTQTPELAIFPPGAAADPERFSVSSFIRLFEDPNLILIQVYLVVLYALIQLLASIYTLWPPRERG